MRDLFGNTEVRHVHTNHRKKGVDVDKPEGYIKRKLRRQLRVVLKRQIAKIHEANV